MISEKSICAVLLDFNGGPRTDRLYEQIRDWNPKADICVLDNASTAAASQYVTHRNPHNTFIGGGLRDCVSLARSRGASHLLYIANDIEPVTPLYFRAFEAAVTGDPSIVQVSSAVTADSLQARLFPWMTDRGAATPRITLHADLLASLIDLDFLLTFHDFPPSKGGWGYSWELAYHANAHARAVAVIDCCTVRHLGGPQAGDAKVVEMLKSQEVATVYSRRYGRLPWADLRRRVEAAFPAAPREAAFSEGRLNAGLANDGASSSHSWSKGGV